MTSLVRGGKKMKTVFFFGDDPLQTPHMEENAHVNITPVQIPPQDNNKTEIQTDSTDCVKENDSVILLENGQKYAVVRISKKA